ncbi:MAG: TetR/AcrR family transcriptional regulator [Novosphingobium sp.]|nr:TetR/AcrR family transcriptional regulator [Novosphingobium sp.]
MGNAIAKQVPRKDVAEGRGNALQAAQREATRERLVAGGIRVFARKGYAACVVADVLAEAGVSRASFYAHFSSKQALAEAIADQFAPVWQPLFADLAGLPGKTLDQLTQWCARFVQFFRDNEDVCVILAQAALLDLEIYRKTAGYQDVLVDLLAEGEPRLAHLRHDAEARLRTGIALTQLHQGSYFLAVYHADADPRAGIETIAGQFHHFLHAEMTRGGR